MKSLMKKIIGLALLLAPTLVFAASGNGGKTFAGVDIPSFQPPLTDRSVDFLGQVFGSMGGVLHGTSGQMLGQLFEAFNYGVLVVAGLFLIYTVIQSIINTANDGQFMGQKFNSAWVIIRVVAGLALLVPKYTGYSLIQVFIMWVVVQGAGLADIAWNKALDYLKEGNAIHTAPQPIPTDFMQQMGDVLAGQVCMYQAGNYKITYRDDQAVFAGGCGVINWGYGGGSKNVANTPSNTNAISNYQTLAVKQILANLQPIARLLTTPLPESQQAQNAQQDRIVAAIVGSAADYVNLIQPARQLIQTDKNKTIDEYYKRSKSEGWIMAGRYYHALGKVQSNLDANLKAYLFDFSKPSENFKRGEAVVAPYTAKAINAVREMYGDQAKYRQEDNSSPGSGYVAKFQNQVTKEINSALADGQNPAGQSVDAILRLQQVGYSLMGGAIGVWTGTSILTIGLGAASVATFLSPAGWISNAVNTAISPVAFSAIGAMFVSGFVIAVYVPMIPYIIWFFATLGWLFAVVVAIVAGPLIALGITHPEGHDWLGKSDQAIMLLLSLFLRPVLMIIGLIVAMIVSRVALDMLMAGFYGVYGDVTFTGSAGANFFTGITRLASLFILIAILTPMIRWVYTEGIEGIPRRVMRWIGLHEETASASAEALQAAEHQTKEMGQQVGESQMAGMRKQSESSAQAGLKNARNKGNADVNDK